MNLTTNTIAKHAILASMLGAIGLPASMSNAQFKVEYSDANNAPKAHAKDSDDQHVIVIQSSDNEHKYEVKIVNGKVEFAEIDGKELKKDRVQIKEEVIVFLGDDGKALHKLRVPGVMSWSQGQPVKVEMLSTGGDNERFVIETNAQQPRVMLGINLTEPGDAMRRQLKLGENQRVILVEKVIEGLPAKKAGLEDYDVILSIDGSEHASGELLRQVMQKKRPGDELKLVVRRAGDLITVVPKLDAYNPELLGVPETQAEQSIYYPALKGVPGSPAGQSSGTPAPPKAPATPRVEGFRFSDRLGPELHGRIMSAIESSGLDPEELARVQQQIETQLESLHGMFMSDGEGAFDLRFELGDHLGEHQHRAIQEAQAAVELARDKARRAMRDAERQVMELRDGKLVLRNAERTEDQLGRLDARLDALEARLDGQMDRLDSQIDRMASMFQRLLNRLEQGDD